MFWSIIKIASMDNKIPIKTLDETCFDFEKNKRFYFFRFIIMWLLIIWVWLKKIFFGSKIKTNTFWFDGVSPVCRKIKEGAFSWKALDIIYNYDFSKTGSFEDKITNFWNQSLNAQSVRNRLKMVRHYLGEIMDGFSRENQEEIRILSIASGSASGVIETINNLKKLKKEKEKIKAMLLDLDPAAIEYSKRLAKKAGVLDKMIFVNKSTSFLEEVVKDFRPHIVEMVGFLEYRPYDKAIKLLGKINKILMPGGVLITSQIVSNSEKIFLYTVVNWPMVYRTSHQFSEILIKAGFSSAKCEIMYEPLKIHGLAVCKK